MNQLLDSHQRNYRGGEGRTVYILDPRSQRAGSYKIGAVIVNV